MAVLGCLVFGLESAVHIGERLHEGVVCCYGAQREVRWSQRCLVHSFLSQLL